MLISDGRGIISSLLYILGRSRTPPPDDAQKAAWTHMKRASKQVGLQSSRLMVCAADKPVKAELV
jgi:hypothetical protein